MTSTSYDVDCVEPTHVVAHASACVRWVVYSLLGLGADCTTANASTVTCFIVLLSIGKVTQLETIKCSWTHVYFTCQRL